MPFHIVPMDASHIKAIAAIEQMCFPDPWSEELLYGALYNEGALWLAAEGPDGEVLGYAGLQAVLDEGYIDDIAVRPDAHRQGIADALLDTFEQFGQAHLAFLSLEVRVSNMPARALYAKHGFVQAGRRKGYYLAPKEDALIMTRFFTKSML